MAKRVFRHIILGPAWYMTKICHAKDLASKFWTKKIVIDLASQM
jgi:hypothetical protein